MAMLESGAVPGTIHIEMNTLDDVERMYTTVQEAGDLLFYRITREAAEAGEAGGRVASIILVGMPPRAHGKVILAFDGWADDPREVFQIPVLVDFCRGLVLGPPGPEEIDPEHIRKLLTVLLDEADRAFDAQGNMVEPRWLDCAGQLWLLGATDPENTYVRENGKWMRNLAYTMYMREQLLRGIP